MHCMTGALFVSIGKQRACYFREMSTVGMHELRRNAREILHRVEGGETVTVTIA